MAVHPLALMRSKRLLPLFLAQFLGAVNDNLFKNAIALLTLYVIAKDYGPELVAVAAGVFIAPFFFLSATAGQIADRYEKAWLVRRIKLAEIAVMVVGVISLVTHNVAFMLTVLFCMGAQSTFLGPARYGYLPEHLRENELVTGNAVMEGGFFTATLIGTIAGGLLILREDGVLIVACSLIGLSLLGYIASLFVPAGRPAEPGLRINRNIAQETWRLVRYAYRQRPLFSAILGMSWFWLVGTFYVAQFPGFTRYVVGGDETIVTLLLSAFTVGIGVGAAVCEGSLRGRVTTAPVSLAAVGIWFFSTDLSLAAIQMEPNSDLFDAWAFLQQPMAWRVLVDVGMIAFCGGFFLVPLNAFLQNRALPSHRARVVAANYIVNAMFMVVGALGAAFLLWLGLSQESLFFGMGLANLVVAVIIVRLLPDDFLRLSLWCLLRVFHRIEVHGLHHVEAGGTRVIAMPNHVSRLDGAILFASWPKKPLSVVDDATLAARWFKPLIGVVEAHSIHPDQPSSWQALIEAVRAGRPLVVFPEMRVSTTGQLMKLYEAPAQIAEAADAVILPVRIEGAERSRLFSPLARHQANKRLFPKIRVTIGPPARLRMHEGVSGKARREALVDDLEAIMRRMLFESTMRHETLLQALLRARGEHGAGRTVLDDGEGQTLSYRGLLFRALLLARWLEGRSVRRERVGVLLPNAIPTVVTLFALHLKGRVPALLNPTTGLANMLSACRLARVQQVVTSRRFVAAAKLGPLLDELRAEVEVIYLEDLRSDLGWREMAHTALRLPLIRYQHRAVGLSPEEPAVVLFTSGSENAPKGVALSSRNILAMTAQARAVVDFGPADRLFNALPLFHSFGLGPGLVLPLVAGVRTLLYPSPLHYRTIPERVYRQDATILFGTDTFLRGYGEAAHGYDFRSLRYVFSGAERLRDDTRQLWAEKFGLRILEGYGGTECSALLSVNTPLAYRPGTCGPLLPEVQARLAPVPGLNEGGRLLVKAPQVMLGYLSADWRAPIQPVADGWYDTGDIVALDEGRFVRVLGRAKRFAKIAGEMVSLAAVEALAQRVWPDGQHAALAQPDPRRGERVILVTSQPGAELAVLQRHARAEGVPALLLPDHIVALDSLPVHATGKIDYPTLERWLADQRAA